MADSRSHNLWVDDWDCLRIEIDSAGDEPFLGTWWLATSWGPSRFLPKGHDAPWVLGEAGCFLFESSAERGLGLLPPLVTSYGRGRARGKIDL